MPKKSKSFSLFRALGVLAILTGLLLSFSVEAKVALKVPVQFVNYEAFEKSIRHNQEVREWQGRVWMTSSVLAGILAFGAVEATEDPLAQGALSIAQGLALTSFVWGAEAYWGQSELDRFGASLQAGGGTMQQKDAMVRTYGKLYKRHRRRRTHYRALAAVLASGLYFANSTRTEDESLQSALQLAAVGHLIFAAHLVF